MVKIAGMVFNLKKPPKERARIAGRAGRRRWKKRDTEDWETLASRADICLPRCPRCRNMVHPDDMRGEVCRACKA